MYNDLINKKVLVTGSSSGIGLKIAKDFSKAGSIVALNGRNKSKLKKAAKNIYNSKMIHGNVEDPKIAKKIVTKAVSLLNGLDLLKYDVSTIFRINIMK